MPALITVATEEGIQLEVRLVRHPLSIGRAADNALRSPDRNVSRHHAVIRRLDDGNYEVEDAGSSYGTFVNGAQVSRQALQHQDQVRIGDIYLRFALVPAIPNDEPVGNAEDATELAAARERLAQLVEQQSDLRREVSLAQDEEDLARKERDEVEAELKRVRRELEEQRKQTAMVEAKAAKLDEDLRVAQSQAGAAGDTTLLQKQLREARGLGEQLRAQIVKMEDRDSKSLTQVKELARLTEQVKQGRDREGAITEAMRQSAGRLEAVTAELADLRKKLAFAEAELEEARRRR